MEIGERVVGGGPSLLNLFLTNPYKFLHRDSVIWVLEFLETKMKGIYKGFNKYISNMFVVKERELEIGYPTDVKHVAHIGWDGQNDSSAPSWMNEFKTSTGFSAKTVSDIGLGGDSQWNSKEIEQSMGTRRSDIFDASIREDLVRKKNKRKKIKSASSSPKASAKTTRAKPKQKFSNTVADSLSCLDV